MAFDAGMVRALVNELNNKLKGARVDKIQQPEKEEIVFTLRADRENVRLSVSSGANNPRVNITSVIKENPSAAPMFCMLLRKHLSGSRIFSVEQYEFERVIEIAFECRDEMGFLCTRYIIAEVMGKYSNIIFCDEKKKVISAIKPIDFTTSSKRQVLAGMSYEYPPKQDKTSPLLISENHFYTLYNDTYSEKKISSFITEAFLGISQIVAREIAYKATGNIDSLLSDTNEQAVWSAFSDYVKILNTNDFTPVLLKNGDLPTEFCFMPIKQFSDGCQSVVCSSFSELIDEYYVKKERANHIKQITSELNKFLSTNENRVLKKISIHEDEIKKANESLSYKALGDIITANIYMLKRGDAKVKLWDYSGEEPTEKEVVLDSRLSPSQNAQRYYKRYNKAKTAIEVLNKQLENDKTELAYIRSVIDVLSRVENENDIEEIRKELKLSGYSVRSKGTQKTNSKVQPFEFKTTNGYIVLCGRNNLQNEQLTFKTAEKSDYWFHSKNVAGSHCIMICNGQEPPEIDFTEAATIAATHSKAQTGENVAVDYTFVKNIKKLPASKPGMVTYKTNWTAYVTPDEKLCEKLRIR